MFSLQCAVRSLISVDEPTDRLTPAASAATSHTREAQVTANLNTLRVRVTVSGLTQHTSDTTAARVHCRDRTLASFNFIPRATETTFQFARERTPTRKPHDGSGVVSKVNDQTSAV